MSSKSIANVTNSKYLFRKCERLLPDVVVAVRVVVVEIVAGVVGVVEVVVVDVVIGVAGIAAVVVVDVSGGIVVEVEVHSMIK